MGGTHGNVTAILEDAWRLPSAYDGNGSSSSTLTHQHQRWRGDRKRRRPRKQQPEGEDDGGEEPEGHANAAEERQGKSRVPAQSALTAAVSLSAPLVLKQHLKMKFDRSFV